MNTLKQQRWLMLTNKVSKPLGKITRLRAHEVREHLSLILLLQAQAEEKLFLGTDLERARKRFAAFCYIQWLYRN